MSGFEEIPEDPDMTTRRPSTTQPPPGSPGPADHRFRDALLLGLIGALILAAWALFQVMSGQ